MSNNDFVCFHSLYVVLGRVPGRTPSVDVRPVGVGSVRVIQAPKQEAILGRLVFQVLLEAEQPPGKKA